MKESVVNSMVNHEFKIKHNYLSISLLTGLIIFLVVLSSKNFVMFHSIIELVCVAVAFNMVGIIAVTKKFNISNQLLFLGVAYGFVGGFDLLHALSFQGNVFSDNTGNLATQLWIIARFIESISLLFMGIIGKRALSFRKIFSHYSIMTLLILVVLFYLRIFPDCFIPQLGPTLFKIVSEYIIIVILIFGLQSLVKNKEMMHESVYKFLFLSFTLTILSEILFTNYIAFTDTANVLGHILKFLSFLCIYKAIVVTSIKEPYLRLIKSEQQKSNLIESLPTGVIIHNGQVIVYYNPRFAQIIGAKNTEELIGKPILEFVHDDYHAIVKSRVNSLIQGKAVETKELKYTKIDKSVIDVEATATPYTYNSENAGLIIVQDITNRKAIERLEEKIEYNQILLEEVQKYDKLKTEFFSTISHELKTPLNIILGIVQLMMNDHSEIIEKCKYHDNFFKHAKTMKQNCYRLLKLINNLIDITRLDSGFMEANLKNDDIVRVVEDIVQSIVSYTNSKGIELIFDTNIEEKIMAFDSDKIERVMLNLLSNSIKFTESGGTIEVNITDKDESIEISVKDTGKGIPQDKKDIIFERFRQVDDVLTRKREGSGIGLSLVKSLIELHKGTISLRSEVNKGSEFTIELPVVLIDDIVKCDEVAATKDINVETIHIEFSDIYS